jgi:hypothetical protein
MLRNPTVTRLSPPGERFARYRLEGGDLAPEWARSLRPGRTAWCEVTVDTETGIVGSFGGEVWPAAWPALFGTTGTAAWPRGTAQTPAVPKLTDAGRAAFGIVTP